MPDAGSAGEDGRAGAARWSLVQQVGRVVLSAGFFVVIAHTVGPGELGRVAAAAAVLNFLSIFADFGLGAALVQRPTLDRRHLDTVFGLNLAVAAGLALLGACASWPAAALLRVPSAQPLIAVLSLSLLVSGASSALAAMAARELRFRALAMRDLPSVLIGGTAGVVLARAGAGAWSVVAQTLVTEVAAMALLWRLAPETPRLRGFTRALVPELWRFGSSLLASNMFKYVVQNLDVLVIGRLFGVTALGRYVLAQRLLLRPIAAATGGVGAAFFSVAARWQADPKMMARQYGSAWALLNYLCLPPAAMLAVWGEPVLTRVLGVEWRGTAPALLALAVIAIAHPPIAPAGQLLKATGRPHWLLQWSMAFSALTATGLLIGARFGFAGALAGLAAGNLLGVVANLVVLRRVLPGTGGIVARRVAPSYGVVAVFTAVAFGARHATESTLVGAALAFVLAGSAAIAVLLCVDGVMRDRMAGLVPAVVRHRPRRRA